MSGDPEQEYFADGISEDIITGLSKLRWFFVIARNSSFTYKGKAVDVKRAARELSVRYVLEGSVRLFSSRSEQLAALALGHAVPTIYQDRDFAVAGGLLSYGTDFRETYRLAGNYTGGFSRAKNPPTCRSSRPPKSSSTSI
jgi:hypothetical protein